MCYNFFVANGILLVIDHRVRSQSRWNKKCIIYITLTNQFVSLIGANTGDYVS